MVRVPLPLGVTPWGSVWPLESIAVTELITRDAPLAKS